MRCSKIGLMVLLLSSPCGVFSAESGPGIDPFDSIPARAERSCKIEPLAKPPEGPTEAGLEAILARPVAVQIDGVPLGKVIDALRGDCRLKLTVDPIEVDEEHVRKNVIATLFARRISLRRLLDAILVPNGLDWVVKGDGLQITSQERAREFVTTKVYPLGDLIVRTGADGLAAHDSGAMMKIMDCLCNTASEKGKVDVTLSNKEARLRVTDHRRFHEEVADLLGQLRAVAKGQRPTDSIEQAMSRKVSVDFVKIPFAQALQQLAEQTGVNFALDHQGLSELGCDSDGQVTLRAKDISLRSVLVLLDQLEESVSFVPYDDFVLVTSREEAECYLRAKAYPIGQLVRVRGPESGAYRVFGGADDLGHRRRTGRAACGVVRPARSNRCRTNQPRPSENLRPVHRDGEDGPGDGLRETGPRPRLPAEVSGKTSHRQGASAESLGDLHRREAERGGRATRATLPRTDLHRPEGIGRRGRRHRYADHGRTQGCNAP